MARYQARLIEVTRYTGNRVTGTAYVAALTPPGEPERRCPHQYGHRTKNAAVKCGEAMHRAHKGGHLPT